MADQIAPDGGPRNGSGSSAERRLERAALGYLERYAAPSAHLRRVLLRKLERAERLSGPLSGLGRAEAAALADRVIAKLQRLGLLDDAAYAEARVRSLHRRGRGERAIRHQLAARGVPAELVDAALSVLRAECPEPDLAAAVAFARRRRLGPFRAESTRTERRERDLAALARAGFDYDIARRVVDAVGQSELEAVSPARD